MCFIASVDNMVLDTCFIYLEAEYDAIFGVGNWDVVDWYLF